MSTITRKTNGCPRVVTLTEEMMTEGGTLTDREGEGRGRRKGRGVGEVGCAVGVDWRDEGRNGCRAMEELGEMMIQRMSENEEKKLRERRKRPRIGRRG